MTEGAPRRPSVFVIVALCLIPVVGPTIAKRVTDRHSRRVGEWYAKMTETVAEKRRRDRVLNRR